MTPDEAWWHHWNELQWLNDFEVEQRYVAQDSEAASILDALCSCPHVDGGCFYPCKQSDIDTVRVLPAPQPPFRKVSQRRALQELAAFNDFDRRPGRSMQRSIRNLDEYLFNRSRLRPGEIPGLVFKAFRDLDKVLFDGYLFGRVRLAWAGAAQIEDIAPGRGSGLMGFSIPRQDRNGGFIFLCIDKLLFGMGSRPFEDDWDNVLTTLIHEMLVRPLLLFTPGV